MIQLYKEQSNCIYRQTHRETKGLSDSSFTHFMPLKSLSQCLCSYVHIMYTDVQIKQVSLRISFCLPPQLLSNTRVKFWIYDGVLYMAWVENICIRKYWIKFLSGEYIYPTYINIYQCLIYFNFMRFFYGVSKINFF